jgi:hypothetical protein
LLFWITGKNLLDFFLGDVMLVDVRLAGLRVNVEAKIIRTSRQF